MKTVLIGALAAVLLVISVHAQNTARLPWGDPDLEGIWTNATLTTLQRAPELGTKAFFTPEEAAAWEKQRIQATNADVRCAPATSVRTTTRSSSAAPAA